jgi:hypothetical protein
LPDGFLKEKIFFLTFERAWTRPFAIQKTTGLTGMFPFRTRINKPRLLFPNNTEYQDWESLRKRDHEFGTCLGLLYTPRI